MFPILSQSSLFPETPTQKFERVMGDYLKSFAALINSPEPTAKQLSEYRERVKERDELLDSDPKFFEKWESIKKASGRHFLFSGKLPSSL